jgi:hypothetical protein
MWQRRLLDAVPVMDFTNNKPGETVTLETAEIVECPACKRPGIVVVGDAQYIAHKFGPGGAPTDVCAPVAEGNVELKMWDAAGNLSYEGVLPEHKKPETQN